MSDQGYINYFSVLDLEEDCKPGEVRKNYKKKMKSLIMEIGRVEITQERRDTYLLDLATHNASYYILRDNARREQYLSDRKNVMGLESAWGEAVASNSEEMDGLRRKFDGALRDFLSAYMEELMLEAGRDPECVEASRWDPAHERHASRVLRHYRQRLYHEIHERLPFHDVTEPVIDW
jgi:hypothetical protein